MPLTRQNIKELKADLRAVFEKHGVEIRFTCSDSSDTHGLRDDSLIVVEKATNKTVIDAHGWHLTQHDLK